jgi:hypothetical protein
MVGYIYIMYNPCILPQGLLKIGLTKCINKRIKSLSNTSVPDDYILLSKYRVKDMIKAEKMVFSKLHSFRHKKEFFLCDLDFANEVSRKVSEIINRPISKIKKKEILTDDELENLSSSSFYSNVSLDAPLFED